MVEQRKKTRKKQAARKSGSGSKRSERRGGKSKGELVSKLLKSVHEKLDTQDGKATVSDFIRLLQLQKEMEEEQPREITVTWVESGEEESGSEK